MEDKDMVTTTETVEQVKEKTEKMYSRDELNKIINAERTKALEEFKKNLEAEKTEAEKLAKMDDVKKAKYELEKERTEKEKLQAEINAYKLKEQAEKISKEKGLPIGYLSLIDFSKANAENLDGMIDNLVQIRSNDLQEYIKDKVKEVPPKTFGTTQDIKKDIPKVF